jgi:hypothetical protein
MGLQNLTDGGTGGLRAGGLRNLSEISEPDSVVSRETDSNSVDTTGNNGLVIETKTDWPSIGVRISSKTSGATTARLEDNSDGSLITDVDISKLSSGDTFTFNGVDLVANKKYNILLNGGGSDYVNGYYDKGASYPYTSDGVDIVARIYKGDQDTVNPINISEVGDLGFS